jgi:hypothetical protein
MATASPKTVEVVAGYALELTKDEADALVVVLMNIAGFPGSTARRFTQEISRALKEAGVDYDTAKYREGFKIEGNFFFEPGRRERDLF